MKLLRRFLLLTGVMLLISSCNQQETSPASLQGIYPIDITELIDPPEKAEDNPIMVLLKLKEF